MRKFILFILILFVSTHSYASKFGDIKITDGTETANVNPSNELQVDDDDGTALLTTIDSDTNIIQGDTTSIDTKLTSGTIIGDVNVVEAFALDTSVDGIEGLIGTTNTTLGTIDTDTGVIAGDTTSMDGKLTTIDTVLDNIDAGKLEETTFTGRIGEVQATPTSNTLLGRLKDIYDAIVDFVKVYVYPHEGTWTDDGGDLVQTEYDSTTEIFSNEIVTAGYSRMMFRICMHTVTGAPDTYQFKIYDYDDDSVKAEYDWGYQQLIEYEDTEFASNKCVSLKYDVAGSDGVMIGFKCTDCSATKEVTLSQPKYRLINP